MQVAWVSPVHDGVEKRVGEDGKMHTKAEFTAYYDPTLTLMLLH